MKQCFICGIAKSKTFTCKRCGKVVCLSCFDFDYWLCAWCREKMHKKEYEKDNNLHCMKLRDELCI